MDGTMAALHRLRYAVVTRPVTFGDYLLWLTVRESFLRRHADAHYGLDPHLVRVAPRELGEVDRKANRQAQAYRLAQTHVNDISRVLPDNAALADRLCRCAAEHLPALLDTVAGADYRIEGLPDNAADVIDATLSRSPGTPQQKAARRKTLERIRGALAGPAVGWRATATGPGRLTHLHATAAAGPQTILVASSVGYPRAGVAAPGESFRVGGSPVLMPDGTEFVFVRAPRRAA
jgi:hypothetical protein